MAAMDRLEARQGAIESQLARRHLGQQRHAAGARVPAEMRESPGQTPDQPLTQSQLRFRERGRAGAAAHRTYADMTGRWG
jgi:hypothetical protein